MTANDTLTILACQISIPPMTTIAQRDAHLEVSAPKVRQQVAQSETLVDPGGVARAFEHRLCARNLCRTEHACGTPGWSIVSGMATGGGGSGCVRLVQLSTRRGRWTVYLNLRCRARWGLGWALRQTTSGAIWRIDGKGIYFNRGNHLFTFTVKGFRLSPIICYDIRIPELTRTLVVDHGVDVILHCGAYYRDESFHTWHPFAIARALENQVFFLSLNRAGMTYGNSLFCLPWQDENTPPIAFEETAEEFRTLTVNREALETARRDYTFLKDRLDDYKIDLLSA